MSVVPTARAVTGSPVAGPAHARVGAGMGPTREIGPNGVERGQVLTTRVGLVLPEDIGFEEWSKAGQQLARLADSTAWCLGDWLAHGQVHFRGRYQAIADALGLESQTLRNYAWLARKFDHARRQPALSLQHHAEVAGLPPAEQDRWLGRAAESAWSRNRLRCELREARDGATSTTPRPAYLPRLRINATELEHWEQLAAAEDVDLVSWMLHALRRAALDRASATIASGPGADHRPTSVEPELAPDRDRTDARRSR